MKIFVAGATGAVGRLLVPLLVGAGHRVTGTSRTEAGDRTLSDQGAVPVRLDVFDPATVRHAVAGAAPDVIIHQLTALSGGDVSANSRIRREGTANLVAAADAAGVRRIIAQSIAWAYEPGAVPADESTPLDLAAPEPRASSVGGVRALEDAVAGVERHVILRYGLLYGPGTWYARGARVADQLRAGELTADAAVSSFLHVEDAARAAVAALDWPNGPVNVVDDEPAPATEWLPALAAALGEPAPPAPTPPPGAGTGRPGWARGASNTLARQKLAWTPAYPSWHTGFTGLS